MSCEIKKNFLAACCQAFSCLGSNIVFCHLGFLDVVETAQLVMETMLLKYRQWNHAFEV
jgi:hypothetical protein